MYFCVYPGVCCRIVINRSVSFSFFLFPPSPSFFSRSADFAPRYVHVRFLYLHDGDDVDALKPENSVNGETHTPDERGSRADRVKDMQERASFVRRSRLLSYANCARPFSRRYHYRDSQSFRISLLFITLVLPHSSFLTYDYLTHARAGSYLLRSHTSRYNCN